MARHLLGNCSQQGFSCEDRQSFLHWAVVAVLLQCRDRGTGDPGDDGASDVALSHDFASVPQDESSLDVMLAEPRRSGCGVWPERKESFLNQRYRWECSQGDVGHRKLDPGASPPGGQPVARQAKPQSILTCCNEDQFDPKKLCCATRL